MTTYDKLTYMQRLMYAIASRKGHTHLELYEHDACARLEIGVDAALDAAIDGLHSVLAIHGLVITIKEIGDE
jgi:hypothetical protein